MTLRHLVSGLLVGVLTAGCSSSASITDDPDLPDGGVDWPDPVPDPNRANRLPADTDGCPGIYAQDRLPTFYLEIDEAAWAALDDSWRRGMEWVRNESPIDESVFKQPQPLAKFQWEDVIITSATIRLRGNPEYWDLQQKMQFQIAFNEYNNKGRFLGLRKMAFDASSPNRNFLRDRLALRFMRDSGIIAPCANNARLFINGQYYGLFTSVEKIDKEFLQRAFDNPEGDLWKRAGWELKTNEQTSDATRLEALNDATTPAGLAEYLDLEQAIRVWAADAIIPNSDGPWAGGLNFYLYDDPSRNKFIVLPWDLDNTFNRLPENVDPYVWKKDVRFHGRPYYDILLQDPAWFDRYIDTIDELVHSGYDYQALQTLISEWAAQVHDAAFEDPNKPFSNSQHLESVDELSAYVELRHLFVADWLSCWKSGGVQDSEGYCQLP